MSFLGFDSKIQVCGFSWAFSETKEAWSGLLEEAKEMGLKNCRELVINSDADKGLLGAAKAVFPEADMNVCVVHAKRNFDTFCQNNVPKEKRARVRMLYHALVHSYDRVSIVINILYLERGKESEEGDGKAQP